MSEKRPFAINTLLRRCQMHSVGVDVVSIDKAWAECIVSETTAAPIPACRCCERLSDAVRNLGVTRPGQDESRKPLRTRIQPDELVKGEQRGGAEAGAFDEKDPACSAEKFSSIVTNAPWNRQYYMPDSLVSRHLPFVSCRLKPLHRHARGTGTQRLEKKADPDPPKHT